ncbi:MAG: GDSL-type esterase/lipase family protein [Firmicutes bacterium]|nr:GDSL-type esterase/lipase family protein [Bacillota bacterium]
MKIINKLSKKSNNLLGEKIPTIAFLGDSVTQGCFEIYLKTDGNIETYFDKSCAYHSYLERILSELFPNVPVNIINAGISGDSATNALIRLERDVLCHNPDLTVVCFGLNDCFQGIDGISKYTESLGEIFDKLLKNGSEVIFMTPNMMNTKISCHIINTPFKDIAQNSMQMQNNGVLSKYIESAKDTAEKYGIPVGDVYSKWQKMSENGVDITELLANKINHPTREMNRLFSYSLIETMFK